MEKRFEVFWAYPNYKAGGRIEFDDYALLEEWIDTQNIAHPGFKAYVWVNEGKDKHSKLYKSGKELKLQNHSNGETKEKWLRLHITDI
ncbi:hypothetical protein [Siphonobacter curvatus]|uniref:Uncharacterized protein n=1 Tax=Siphonobacter curvatus TaxID=2094562 RepID=A0A2S7IR71_9BACT|nr:hypothetical protein [Siphonobacter curvatus]PQA60176.1 hypothetical protein C5O19_11315 [Siphonobacter curvatus]